MSLLLSSSGEGSMTVTATCKHCSAASRIHRLRLRPCPSSDCAQQRLHATNVPATSPYVLATHLTSHLLASLMNTGHNLSHSQPPPNPERCCAHRVPVPGGKGNAGSGAAGGGHQAPLRL